MARRGRVSRCSLQRRPRRGGEEAYLGLVGLLDWHLSSDLIGSMSSPQCGELIEPIGSYERCPQPIDPQVRLLSLSAGASLQGAARNPRANPMKTRSLWGKGGRLVVVPPLFHAPRIENPDPSSHL